MSTSTSATRTQTSFAATSQHLRAAARPGHRHDARADPGGAGPALHLRRRAGRPGRAHRSCRALCGGRVFGKRAPRGQSPGVQQPAGMLRVRRCRRARHSGVVGCVRPPPEVRAGTKAAWPIPTKTW
jgi:hypothetical protein